MLVNIVKANANIQRVSIGGTTGYIYREKQLSYSFVQGTGLQSQIRASPKYKF